MFPQVVTRKLHWETKLELSDCWWKDMDNIRVRCPVPHFWRLGTSRCFFVLKLAKCRDGQRRNGTVAAMHCGYEPASVTRHFLDLSSVEKKG